MIDTHFRPIFQKVCVLPIANYIKNTKTTPTTISLAALFSGLLATPFITFGAGIFSIFFLLLSGYLDNLDGVMARFSKEKKDSGTVIDIMSNRIVEFGVILALFGYNPKARAFITLLVLGSLFLCVTSFLVVGIFTKNKSEKSFHYSPGIIERTELFAFFILLILFPKAFTALGITLSILLLLTAGLRIWKFLKQAFYDEL